MKCPKCGVQKILVKNNNNDKQMWVNLNSLTPEEIRTLQAIRGVIIKFKPGVHILHYTTCKDNINEISKKQKRTRGKSRYSGRID